MGGGAIRAASKVAGGFRSIASEFSLSAAVRKASSCRPVAAAVDDLKLTASSSASGGVQSPCVEVDDWLLPFKEEVGIDASETMPRVVFGSPPTLEEAKEATSELSIALEKAFLSTPNSVGCEGSVVTDEDSNSSLSSKEVMETKSTNSVVGSSVPAPAIMAFKFLHESSAAKEVVASIASDPNVWTAVLQNQDLQKFLESQTACFACTGGNFSVESFDNFEDKSFKNAEESNSQSGYGDFLWKIKNSVVNMMNSLSDYFKNLFGGKGDGISGDKVMEGTFIGLAVMAILVILFKRA